MDLARRKVFRSLMLLMEMELSAISSSKSEMNCSRTSSFLFCQGHQMRPRNSNIKGANLARMAAQLSALALALGCSVASAQSIPQGTFIADGNTGCKVWNPNPKSVETIVWSGSCVNGLAQGRGKLQWLQNDKIYETDEGEWSAGRQVGSWLAGMAVGPLRRRNREQ